MPKNTQANISSNSWALPPVFQWLQTAGNIESQEMYRTFNCGIGMVLVVPANEADAVLASAQELGETAYNLGQLNQSDQAEPSVIIS